MGAKTILITGAGRGIGRATAVRFARGGANVVLMARSAGELEDAATAVHGAGGMALVARGDVANEADVERVVRAATDRFGRIDVLVNAAGVAPLSALPEMSAEAFDALVAVNVRGVFLMCRAVWAGMAGQGGGTIVNVSSRAAADPFPGFSAYGGTKAFVEVFTKAIAAEGRGVGIRVFAVAPGAVETVMLRGLFPDYPKEQTLAADEVAGVIEWLTDARCAECSGQTVSVVKSA